VNHPNTRPISYIRKDRAYDAVIRVIVAETDLSYSAVIRQAIKLLLEKNYPHLLPMINGPFKTQD
jgi:hypothetical protein